jgi:hypothetical protein
VRFMAVNRLPSKDQAVCSGLGAGDVGECRCKNLTSPKSLTLDRVNRRCVNRERLKRSVASNHFCAGARAATASYVDCLGTHFLVDNPNPRVYNTSQHGRQRLPDCRER